MRFVLSAAQEARLCSSPVLPKVIEVWSTCCVWLDQHDLILGSTPSRSKEDTLPRPTGVPVKNSRCLRFGGPRCELHGASAIGIDDDELVTTAASHDFRRGTLRKDDPVSI